MGDRLIGRVIDLLENRINDIPGYEVRNTHEYKCERGWFGGVLSNGQLAAARGKLDKKTVAYFWAMEKYFRKTGLVGVNRRWTEEKDIKMGNRVLVMMLRDFGVGKYLKVEKYAA